MATPDIPKVTIQQSNMIQNEVQDFSMGSKKSNNPPPTTSINLSTTSGSSNSGGAKGKLDDMLSKLMKKKNAVSIF